MNTDFPNDYVAARLVREGYIVDRVYEWEWFEEQKERMGVTQPTAGFIPHTPFSVVPMLPFSWLEPLVAKRAWIAFSLGLLSVSILFTSKITSTPWRWILAAACWSLPLYRNLEYGQYYILLLFLLSAALWADVNDRRFLAGLLLALAFGLKIFPVVIVLFYVRKRDYRAIAGFAAGTVFVVGASLVAFGQPACMRFVKEILPSAMQGEAMNPFALPANSFSALLHHLFVYQQGMSSSPLVNAPVLVGMLEPFLQWFLLAPAILLCSPARHPQRDRLEWCALLTATLTISTLPASYNFVVLLLPCAVFFGFFSRDAKWLSATLCAALYISIGWVMSPIGDTSGLRALLGVPRLWLLVLLSALFYAALYRGMPLRIRRELLWAVSMGVVCLVQIARLSRHEEHLYNSHEFLATRGPEFFVEADLHATGDNILFYGMTSSGWRWAVLDPSRRVQFVQFVPVMTNAPFRLVEKSGRHSIWLADRGTLAKQVSPADLDVYDFSVLDPATVLFSAMATDGSVGLYRVSESGEVQSLGIKDARFPSISPDGQLLAYSKLEHGYWHLSIRDQASGKTVMVGTSDCNDAHPVWDNQSRKLTYVSDCGRGLWQTSFATFTVMR